jgi:hypothetical protein
MLKNRKNPTFIQRNKKTTPISSLVIISMLMIIFIFSCSSEEETNNEKNPIIPDVTIEAATVSFYNFYTDSVNIEWVIEKKSIVTRQEYSKSINNQVITWQMGNSTVLIEVYDSPRSKKIASSNLALNIDQKYFASVVGNRSSGRIVLEKMNISNPGRSSANIRFLNAIPNAGAVDVYIGGTASSQRRVIKLSYRAITSYIEVDIQQLAESIIVTPTGVDPNSSSNIMTLVDADFFEGNKTYTCVLAHEKGNLASEKTIFALEEN